MGEGYIVSLIISVLVLICGTNAQLSANFYETTCPSLETIVNDTLSPNVSSNPRLAASVLRLPFHDCFVNGCDASILLDDSSTLTGEKSALLNQGLLEIGYDIIDAIKANVEATCAATVSCADIIALAARDGAVLLGAQSWTVPLGRRDSLTANLSGANTDLASSGDSLSTLISKFAAKNLTADEMTVLSGSHTIGQARCVTFRTHIYNDTNIDPAFATSLQANCPASGGDNNTSPLDVQTPNTFENNYYKNLVAQQGLLGSDQVLYNGGSQDALVANYSTDNAAFLSDFGAAMIRMTSISPLTGTDGEIRLNCRVPNSNLLVSDI